MVSAYFFILLSISLASTSIFVPIFSAAFNMDVKTPGLSIPKSGCLNIMGSGISSMGEASTAREPSLSNASRSGLLESSMQVFIYSLPWIPSLVGLTISDMSVHMESNPLPTNGPLYPEPETGIFPVWA